MAAQPTLVRAERVAGDRTEGLASVGPRSGPKRPMAIALDRCWGNDDRGVDLSGASCSGVAAHGTAGRKSGADASRSRTRNDALSLPTKPCAWHGATGGANLRWNEWPRRAIFRLSSGVGLRRM